MQTQERNLKKMQKKKLATTQIEVYKPFLSLVYFWKQCNGRCNTRLNSWKATQSWWNVHWKETLLQPYRKQCRKEMKIWVWVNLVHGLCDPGSNKLSCEEAQSQWFWFLCASCRSEAMAQRRNCRLQNRHCHRHRHRHSCFGVPESTLKVPDLHRQQDNLVREEATFSFSLSFPFSRLFSSSMII